MTEEKSIDSLYKELSELELTMDELQNDEFYDDSVIFRIQERIDYIQFELNRLDINKNI